MNEFVTYGPARSRLTVRKVRYSHTSHRLDIGTTAPHDVILDAVAFLYANAEAEEGANRDISKSFRFLYVVVSVLEGREQTNKRTTPAVKFVLFASS